MRLLKCTAFVTVALFLFSTQSFFAAPPLYGQTGSEQPIERPSTWTLHAGFSFPSGDFGDDIGSFDDGNGYAKSGFVVSGTYSYPVGPVGLRWVSNVSLVANSFDTDAAFDDVVDNDDVSVSSGYWINVPIMTGLKYQTQASPTLDVYGLGQLGVNLNKGPSIDLEDNSGNSVSHSYGTATSLSFNAGAGIVINDRYDIGLRYKRLGEPELDLESEVVYDRGSDTTENTYKQSLSMIQILVGIKFG